MIASVARRYTFTATHAVEGLGPQWSVDHAHSYTVEVVARGAGPVVVDTDEMDAVWEQWRSLCESAYLNHTIGGSTTVEDLAERMFDWFAGPIPTVSKVTVWEDDSRWGSAER